MCGSVKLIKKGKIMETTRTNLSCSTISGENTETSQNYSCTIDMWYWDLNGVWDIGISATDSKSEKVYNTTKNFVYNSLKSVVIDKKS